MSYKFDADLLCTQTAADGLTRLSDGEGVVFALDCIDAVIVRQSLTAVKAEEEIRVKKEGGIAPAFFKFSNIGARAGNCRCRFELHWQTQSRHSA
jgi:hypothetical protein